MCLIGQVSTAPKVISRPKSRINKTKHKFGGPENEGSRSEDSSSKSSVEENLKKAITHCDGEDTVVTGNAIEKRGSALRSSMVMDSSLDAILRV